MKVRSAKLVSTWRARTVREIVDVAERTGTTHLGIVPDFGIFQIRPSEVLLQWFERHGAKASASEASVELASLLRHGAAPFKAVDMSYHTAGNLRSAFNQFLMKGGIHTSY